MIAWHCDREGCDSWARGANRQEFVVLTAHPHKYHFCCMDCLFQFSAAHSEPTDELTL